MDRRTFMRTGCALGAGLAAGSVRAADAPLGLVVPYPAGGPLDTAARAIGQQLQAAEGTTVVVENRPGAGGGLGVAHVARATPDGTRIVMGAVATHAINPWLQPSLPYDALADFAPITLVSRVPNVLVMTPQTADRLGFADVQGLIRHAKARPGELRFASGGNGSGGHLAGELFKRRAGVDMLHVPYNGAAPALNGLLGGQTELMFDNLASASPHIQAGKLRALAVTTQERASALPTVPVLADTLPGFEISTWFGLFAPAGTPAPVIERLNRGFTAALRHPETVARLARMSAEPRPMSPDAFGEFVRQEHAAYGQLIKSAGIRME